MKFISQRNLAIVFALVVIGEGAWLAYDRYHQSSPQSLEAHAQAILASCSGASYKPSCYDEEIPKLMDSLSMEEAFEVTRIVQDYDRSYAYCHVLGHELSAREVQKDPSQWKDIVVRCPSGMCSNGCLHGGFQERFRTEHFTTDEEVNAVKPDLYDLCEARGAWRPTGLEQGSCYHALGHLTMYITNADIKKSIVVCDEVALKKDGRDFRQLCYDGAFMQIFQPLEPDDFTLIEGKEVDRDELPSFCAQFSGKQFGSCRSEAWPLFRKELTESPVFLASYCAQSGKQEEERCVSAIMYVIAAQFGLDGNRIAEYCAVMPSQHAGRCFANAASRMLEVDKRNIDQAAALCGGVKNKKNQDECFAELVLYAGYNFHRGSEDFYKTCNALPEAWQKKCTQS